MESYITRKRMSSKEICEVKRHLRNWARSNFVANSLKVQIEEIKKLKSEIIGMSEEGQKALGEYDKHIEDLAKEHDKIVTHCGAMECYLSYLEPECAKLLRLKYFKGLTVDYVAAKLIMSRATLFRRQTAALNELAEIMASDDCLYDDFLQIPKETRWEKSKCT